MPETNPTPARSIDQQPPPLATTWESLTEGYPIKNELSGEHYPLNPTRHELASFAEDEEFYLWVNNGNNKYSCQTTHGEIEMEMEVAGTSLSIKSLAVSLNKNYAENSLVRLEYDLQTQKVTLIDKEGQIVAQDSLRNIADNIPYYTYRTELTQMTRAVDLASIIATSPDPKIRLGVLRNLRDAWTHVNSCLQREVEMRRLLEKQFDAKEAMDVLVGLPWINVRESRCLLQLLASPENHADLMAEIVDRLENCGQEHMIARYLAIFTTLNHGAPEYLALSHSQLIVTQLRSIAYGKDNRYKQPYFANSFYDRLIWCLENDNDLMVLMNKIERYRRDNGIATPFPLEGLIVDWCKQTKGADHFSAENPLTAADVDNFVAAAVKMPFGQLDQFETSLLSVFTSTGTGRTPYESVIRFREILGDTSDTVLLEPAASIGVSPANRAYLLEIPKAVATDLMPEPDLKSVEVGVIWRLDDDGTPILVNEKRSAVKFKPLIDALVEQHWQHNILETPLVDFVSPRDRKRRKVIGLHNILVHLIDNERVIQMSTHGLLETGDFIWTSGGFCGYQPGILHDCVWQRTQTGLKLVLARKAPSHMEEFVEKDNPDKFVQPTQIAVRDYVCAKRKQTDN